MFIADVQTAALSVHDYATEEEPAMNKLFTALSFCAVIVPATALAVPPPPPGPNVEMLTDWLNLSEEQQREVEQIFKAERSKHEAAHKETEAELRTVLTAEQYQRFQAAHERRPRPDCDCGGMDGQKPHPYR